MLLSIQAFIDTMIQLWSQLRLFSLLMNQNSLLLDWFNSLLLIIFLLNLSQCLRWFDLHGFLSIFFHLVSLFLHKCLYTNCLILRSILSMLKGSKCIFKLALVGLSFSLVVEDYRLAFSLPLKAEVRYCLSLNISFS